MGDTMLIRPSEQGGATTLDLWIRHLCVRRWEKNLGAFYRSEISRGPVVWGMLRYPFQGLEE